MTNTKVNPKVSVISPRDNTSSSKKTGSGTSKSILATKDSYSKKSPNPYSGLIRGNPKAIDPSLIGEFLAEEEAIAPSGSSRRIDPMQEFIGTLMMGDAEYKPTQMDFNIPLVPDFYTDIVYQRSVSTPVAADAAIETYQSLKKVLAGIKEKIGGFLDPANMVNMEANEILALNDVKKELEARIDKCAIELSKATRYKEKLKKELEVASSEETSGQET